PFFGKLQMKEISVEAVQSFVSTSSDNPKTIRNCVMTLRMIWNSATAWGYVAHDPFKGLVLPEYVKPEQPCFAPEQAKAIIEKLEEPYHTIGWALAETGIRRGEVCGLNVGSVALDANVIIVRNAVSRGQLGSTKARRPRVVAISSALCARLKLYIAGR